MKAEITFAPNQPLQTFEFHLTASGNAWRLLADDQAFVLVPLCDTLARPVSTPPVYDRLEIWPCRWGCPDFSQTNLHEYAELKRRFFAGEIQWQGGPMPHPDQQEITWVEFLEKRGNQMLWEQCATDETKLRWLNGFGDPASLGNVLFISAQLNTHQRRSLESTILLSNLGRILFRADFCNGKKRQTIFLADCKPDLLTADEKRLSPQFIAQEEARLHKQIECEASTAKNIADMDAAATRLNAVAKEVGKATGIGDLYANPSIADAKNAAIKRKVPKEFVAYCHTEWCGTGFPTTDQAFKAVQTKPLFRALRGEKAPSRSTVGRWHLIVRGELENRGIIQRRPKTPPAQKVAHYNVERHPETTLELAEQELEQSGRTDRDTRSQELGDPVN